MSSSPNPNPNFQSSQPRPTSPASGQSSFREENLRYLIIEQQVAATSFPPLWREGEVLYQEILTLELAEALPGFASFDLHQEFQFPTSGYFETLEAAQAIAKLIARKLGNQWPMSYRVEGFYLGLSSPDQLLEEYRRVRSCKLDSTSRAAHERRNAEGWERRAARFRERQLVRVKLACESYNAAQAAAAFVHNSANNEYLAIEKIFDSPYKHDNKFYVLGWILLTPTEEDFRWFKYGDGLKVTNNWTDRAGQREQVEVFGWKAFAPVLEGFATGKSANEAAEMPEIWELLGEWLEAEQASLAAANNYTPPPEPEFELAGVVLPPFRQD